MFNIFKTTSSSAKPVAPAGLFNTQNKDGPHASQLDLKKEKKSNKAPKTPMAGTNPVNGKTKLEGRDIRINTGRDKLTKGEREALKNDPKAFLTRCASRKCSLEEFSKLVRFADAALLNAGDGDGKTLLHHLIEARTNTTPEDLKAVVALTNAKIKELIQRDAVNVNLSDGDGNTPAHLAAYQVIQSQKLPNQKHQDMVWSTVETLCKDLRVDLCAQNRKGTKVRELLFEAEQAAADPILAATCYDLLSATAAVSTARDMPSMASLYSNQLMELYEREGFKSGKSVVEWLCQESHSPCAVAYGLPRVKEHLKKVDVYGPNALRDVINQINLPHKKICSPEGHRLKLKILLTAGIDVDRAGNDGIAPIHRAVEHGGKALEALLKKGPKLDAVDQHGNGVFHHAFAHSLPIDKLKLLLDAASGIACTKPNVDHQHPLEWLPLRDREYVLAVARLVENRPSFTIPSSVFKVIRERDPDLAERMARVRQVQRPQSQVPQLAQAKDMQQPTGSSNPAVRWTQSYEAEARKDGAVTKKPMLAWLFSKRVDIATFKDVLRQMSPDNVNARDSEGRSVLHHLSGALLNGKLQWQYLEALLASGKCNVNLQDTKSRTPLDIAAHACSKPGSVKRIKMLCATEGINVSLQNWKGQTPIAVAAYSDHTGEAVACMLRHPTARPNLPDENGLTPLVHAAWAGQVRNIEVLLQDERVRANIAEDRKALIQLGADDLNEDVLNLFGDRYLSDASANARQANAYAMNVTQYEMHLRDLEMTEKIKDAFVTLKVSRNATLLECYDASRRLGRACLADESAGKAATAESIHKIMTAYKTIEDFLTKIRARATADIKRPN